jgi:hypothetical protein
MAANIPAKILVLAASIILASLSFPAQVQGQEQGRQRPVAHSTSYRTIQIDGLSIFYREAGPKHYRRRYHFAVYLVARYDKISG